MADEPEFDDDDPLVAPIPGGRRRRGGPQHIPRPPGLRLGDPAPWAELPAEQRRPALSVVRDALADGPAPRPSPVESVGGRASAVLAPLYEVGGEPHLILTRRAWHMRAHKGELSFPGGGQDPGETLWETALREAHEEIALEPSVVSRIGELHHLSTISSRAFIVPFVGVLDELPELTPSPDEVDAILHVSVWELLDPAIYHQERWGLPGVDRPIHFFELAEDTLWGATGSMIVDLLTRITVGGAP